jgi:hypothetical protein
MRIKPTTLHQAGQPKSAMCIVTSASSEEEEKYYDDQDQTHGLFRGWKPSINQRQIPNDRCARTFPWRLFYVLAR